jgi:hypothetical protein
MPSRAHVVSAAGEGFAALDGTSRAAIRDRVAEALPRSVSQYGAEPAAWLTSLLTSHLKAAFSAHRPQDDEDAYDSAALDAELGREVLRITVNLGIGMLEAMTAEDLDALLASQNHTTTSSACARPRTTPLRIYTLSPQLGATHLVLSPALSRGAVMDRLQRAFPAASMDVLESLAPMMFMGRFRGNGAEVISWGSGVAYSPNPQALIARVHARMNSTTAHHSRTTSFESAMEAA